MHQQYFNCDCGLLEYAPPLEALLDFLRRRRRLPDWFQLILSYADDSLGLHLVSLNGVDAWSMYPGAPSDRPDVSALSVNTLRVQIK